MKQKRRNHKPEKKRPRWWNQMYNRSTKNIPSHTWSKLMIEPSVPEILTTIKKIPTDKAAGYVLTEQENSPLTNILTHLFKVAFTKVQHGS